MDNFDFVWNSETDGEQICICEDAGNESSLPYVKSPATGEPPVLMISGALVLMLVCIIALGKKRR